MKAILVATVLLTMASTIYAQNVGIGTSAPAYKVDVIGKIHNSNDLLTDGNLGIGTISPAYKISVQDGSIALLSSSDLKVWYLNYSSANKYYQLVEGNTPRIVVANGGNVGIGTTSPSALLDVAGDMEVTGNLKVNNGKGVVRSWNSSQIKYYTQTAAFTAVIGAFGNSAEATIAWPTGIFTNPPKVLVGDITYTGGTAGDLWRVQLVTYGTTTSSCKARLINTSDGPVNYAVTWNIVLIGD